MRSFQCWAITATTGCLVGSPAVLRAQSEHVFLIKAAGCRGGSPQRAQTGFRVLGVKGLVTALHGVVGCRLIAASDDSGEVRWSGLRIVRADVGRDVALVTSDQLDAAPDAGFTPLSEVPSSTVLAVTAYGHPYAMKIQADSWFAHPPLRQLKDLVPPLPAVLNALSARNSPAPSTAMLRIQGSALPGHSGAPVLAAGGRLLGIVNGGLYGGTVDRSWGVPWPEIRWTADANSWSRLAGLDPGLLFATDDRYFAAFPIIVSQEDSASTQLGPGRVMRTDLQIMAGGSLRATTTMSVDTTVTAGFCGSAVVALFDAKEALLASRSFATPLCVGSAAGSTTLPHRTEAWAATLSDSVLGRVAQLAISHTVATPESGIAVIAIDSSAGTKLSFLERRVVGRAHTFFTRSGHVLAEAALFGDSLLRVVARYENDDLLVGFRAHVTVVLHDSAGSVLRTVSLREVERRPKSPGRSMCTEVVSNEAIPRDTARMVRRLTVQAREHSRFNHVGVLQPGFRCVERPFVGPRG